MLKVISAGGAIGGLANVSADMVTHAAAIAAMRATFVSVWREKILFKVFFIMCFAAEVNWFFKWRLCENFKRCISEQAF